MKLLIDSNLKINGKKDKSFYDVLLNFCFLENKDAVAQSASHPKTIEESHELFIEKLQFFIDSLHLLQERHVPQFS